MTAVPPNPWGSCFDAAAWNLIGNDDRGNPQMCHGIGVANKPGEEGTPIAHAWIELDHPDHGRIAIDPIWLVAQPADRYRRNLQVSYAVTYGREEFLRRVRPRIDVKPIWVCTQAATGNPQRSTFAQN